MLSHRACASSTRPNYSGWIPKMAFLLPLSNQTCPAEESSRRPQRSRKSGCLLLRYVVRAPLRRLRCATCQRHRLQLCTIAPSTGPCFVAIIVAVPIRKLIVPGFLLAFEGILARGQTPSVDRSFLSSQFHQSPSEGNDA